MHKKQQLHPSFDSPLNLSVNNNNSPIIDKLLSPPIYNNLSNRRNINEKLTSIITKPINELTNDESDKNKIMLELDKEILSIHLINQQIIHNHIVKVNPNEELLTLLLKYDEHVTVYNILRKLYPSIHDFKQVIFPSKFNAEYPYALKGKIESELYKLKTEQNLLTN